MIDDIIEEKESNVPIVKTDDYNIYRLYYEPPEKDMQECIIKYFDFLSSNDWNEQLYLTHFLHKAEPKINNFCTVNINKYSMEGHFADFKQNCVMAILLALKDYDIEKCTDFYWFAKKFYFNKAIDECIRQLRPGLSVDTQSEYSRLRKIMWAYNTMDNPNSEESLKQLAEKLNMSEPLLIDYLQGAVRNQNILFSDSLYENDSEDNSSSLPLPDSSAEPSYVFFKNELRDKLFSAFDNLSVREKEVVSRHLGFCPECFSTYTIDSNGEQVSNPKEPFSLLCFYLGINEKTASRIYKKAIKQMKEEIQKAIK